MHNHSIPFKCGKIVNTSKYVMLSGVKNPYPKERSTTPTPSANRKRERF